MRSTLSSIAMAALAALLVSACNGNQSSTTTTVANTTEVTPTDAETSSVSDAMVTNIDAAAPTGADSNGTEAMPSDMPTDNGM